MEDKKELRTLESVDFTVGVDGDIRVYVEYGVKGISNEVVFEARPEVLLEMLEGASGALKASILFPIQPTETGHNDTDV